MHCRRASYTATGRLQRALPHWAQLETASRQRGGGASGGALTPRRHHLDRATAPPEGPKPSNWLRGRRKAPLSVALAINADSRTRAGGRGGGQQQRRRRSTGPP